VQILTYLLVHLEEAIKVGEDSGGGFTCRVDLNPESRSSWVEFLLGEFPKSILRGTLSLSFPSGLLLLLLLRVLISTLSGGVWSLSSGHPDSCLLACCYCVIKTHPPHFHPDFGVIYSQLNTSKTLKWSVLANSKHHNKTPYDWVPLQIKTIILIHETPNYHLTSVPLAHGCQW